jgi:nucleotidyltransferase/DNA polymerase involved in DNA repair
MQTILSITPYCHEHDLDPEACVQRIRQDVFDTVKLTVSAGIAPNKVCPYIILFSGVLELRGSY